ncbi:MAG: hypothetical protein HYY26_07125 [Acidobacteria bacterium]|nr:hypothetical protein [Acidobacteriota bacterium]
MSRSSLSVAVACFLLTLLSYGAPDQERTPEKQTAGESKNWKVVVVSAECRLAGEQSPWHPQGERISWDAVRENHCLLFLHLVIQYKGPNGTVSAPRVTLATGKGEKFHNFGNLHMVGDDPTVEPFEVVEWLMSATYADEKEHKTLPLITGQKFGSPYLGFLLEIPKDAQALRLVFGGEEIPGIIIRPTKAK